MRKLRRNGAYANSEEMGWVETLFVRLWYFIRDKKIH